ncbi:MAG: type II secretion system protein GspM [Candidatus Binatia bacterium]
MKKFWERLSKRERRMALLACSIFVLVLGNYLVLEPYSARREWVKSQLEIQTNLLERQNRYLKRRTQIEGDLKRLKTKLETLKSSLLGGDTPPVSASALQETVRKIAAKEGVQIVSTRVLSPKPVGSFLTISVQLEVSGEVGQLVNLIKGIESNAKFLMVSEVNIRSLASRVNRRRRPVLRSRGSLRTTLVISGFARSRMATDAKSGV